MFINSEQRKLQTFEDILSTILADEYEYSSNRSQINRVKSISRAAILLRTQKNRKGAIGLALVDFI